MLTTTTNNRTSIHTLHETGKLQLRINNTVRLANEEKDKTINRLQGELNLRKQILSIPTDMPYAASEVFKRAIDTIIAYGTEKYKSIFGNDEAANIKNVMQTPKNSN